LLEIETYSSKFCAYYFVITTQKRAKKINQSTISPMTNNSQENLEKFINFNAPRIGENKELKKSPQC
jgi:ferritin-like protein